MIRRVSEILAEICGSVTVHEMRRTIGRSVSYVSQIRGGTLIPTDDVLYKIAAAYAPERLGELLCSAAVSRLEKHKGFRDSEVEIARKAMVGYFENSKTTESPESPKMRGRTLLDFPSAFEPLAVITGDKREEKQPHISVADFGAYTATPADMRWLCNLGLSTDTVIHVDKHGLLPDEDAADKKFGHVNLLIIGSPAANHVARMANPSAIFRFNYTAETESLINNFLEEARKQRQQSLQALEAYHEKNRNVVRNVMRNLFTGGIVDPTNHDTYRAAEFHKIVMETQYDFGVLTFCANPFYQRVCQKAGVPHDFKYISILAAGIHHPATAHAVRMLGKDSREKPGFSNHPYGGVLRITLNTNIPPFARRVEEAEVQWEDEVDEDRRETVTGRNQKETILKGLRDIEHSKKTISNIQMDKANAADCIQLIENL